MPDKFLEAGQHLTERTVQQHLETEPMRIVYTTGNTVDAVPLRDEFAGFANDRHDDGFHIPVDLYRAILECAEEHMPEDADDLCVSHDAERGRPPIDPLSGAYGSVFPVTR